MMLGRPVLPTLFKLTFPVIAVVVAQTFVAAPWGFRHVRVHDLKHTFGRRLRARRFIRGPTGPARSQEWTHHDTLLAGGAREPDRRCGEGLCAAVPQNSRIGSVAEESARWLTLSSHSNGVLSDTQVTCPFGHTGNTVFRRHG